MRTFAIHNLGCKVNSYEAESMEQMLVNAGYKKVPFDENVSADIYIINTCSVTNIADRKSRQMLHKAKKMNPDSIVIAAGCYVQADSDNIEKDTAVDMIVGNNMKINIVEAIEAYEKNNKQNILIKDLSVKQPYEELEIDRVNEHTRAYIKIQDGCNQFCSYCIIPYTRGRIRSREMSSIITEVNRLAQKGYKEVVLTGIHLSSYGLDNGSSSLIEVIEAIENIDGIERIRIGSLEPRIITDEFVIRLSKVSKLCPHFHLSLQSGCDKTLKDMNRRYNTYEFKISCDIIRKYMINPAITTDVIVGFPGETEDDFNQTKKYLEDIHFYEMHIFKFSRRKGTVADKLPNQIDEKIKSERSNILINIGDKMSQEYRESFIGNYLDVLIEESFKYNNEIYYCGYTKNYIRILISKTEFELKGYKEKDIINCIFKCKCIKLEDGKYMISNLK